ncbi:MAG: ATP-binding protein [Thermoguttaceae bacterium]
MKHSESGRGDRFSPQSNPFSSRFLRLGDIPFFFQQQTGEIGQLDLEQSECLEELSNQFGKEAEQGRAKRGGRGECPTVSQIVGPHGTGKSTLLTFLATFWLQQGKTVHFTVLRDKERTFSQEFWNRLKKDLASAPTAETAKQGCATESSVVIIDGYEQLGWFSRFKLRRLQRRFPFQLLLSVHQPIRSVPVLYTTVPTFDLLQHVVRFLLRSSDWMISEEELRPLYERFSGNFREIIAALYDLYEIGDRD